MAIISSTHVTPPESPVLLPCSYKWRIPQALLPPACRGNKHSAQCSAVLSLRFTASRRHSECITLQLHQHVTTPLTSHVPKRWLHSIKRGKKVCTAVLFLSYTYLYLLVGVDLPIIINFFFKWMFVVSAQCDLNCIHKAQMGEKMAHTFQCHSLEQNHRASLMQTTVLSANWNPHSRLACRKGEQAMWRPYCMLNYL